jgi:hypothetical protein
LIKGEDPADDGPADAGPRDVRTADPGPPDTDVFGPVDPAGTAGRFDADDTQLTFVTMTVAAAVPAVDAPRPDQAQGQQVSHAEPRDSGS